LLATHPGRFDHVDPPKHGSRRLLHFNVTDHPSAEWTLQQLPEAPGCRDFRYLMHDRDSIFRRSLDVSIKNLGLAVLKSPPCSPKANAICERVIGTIRRGRVEDWRVGVGRSLCSPFSSPFRLRVSQHLDHATFPAPAASNAACGFPALRSPDVVDQQSLDVSRFDGRAYVLGVMRSAQHRLRKHSNALPRSMAGFRFPDRRQYVRRIRDPGTQPTVPVSPTIRRQSAPRPTPGFPWPSCGSGSAALRESAGGRADTSISKTTSSAHGAIGSWYSAERRTAHRATRSILPGWPD